MLLTWGRLFSPILVITAWELGWFGLGLGLAIFFAWTDYFDGLLARRFKVSSDLGSKLDPVADKIFILFISLFCYWQNYLPAYYFIILWLRNCFQLSSFPVIVWWLKINFKVKPLLLPKIATSLSFILLLFILGKQLFPVLDHPLLDIMVIISSVIELYILIDFFWQSSRIIRKVTDTYQ